MDRIDCERARCLIHLRLDGELRDDESRLLDEHLEQCGDCRSLQEDLERVDAALREGLGAIEVFGLGSAGVAEQQVDATRQQVTRARRSRWMWATWLPAAAALMIVGLALLVGVPKLQRQAAVDAAPAVVISGGDAIHVFQPNQRTAQSGETGGTLQEASVAWGLGGEQIALEFAGGAQVGLSDEAVVRIGRESIDLFKGNLRADLQQSSGDFTVVTPWGDFSGPGSLFLVHSDVDGGAARLTVITGEVLVETHGRRRTLSAGEAITLKPDPQQTISL